MINELPMERPSVEELLKHMKHWDFNNEESFHLSESAQFEIKRRLLFLTDENKEIVQIASQIKTINFEYTFDKFNSAYKKSLEVQNRISNLMKLNTKMDDTLTFLNFLAIYFEIMSLTELKIKDARKKNESALKEFKNLLPNLNSKLRNPCLMIFYTLYNTRCQIALHEINQFYLENNSNLLNVNEMNPELIGKFKQIKQDIMFCLTNKQETSSKADTNDLPLDFYLNLNLFKSFVNCYYTLCCLHWHLKEYPEIRNIISLKILKMDTDGKIDPNIPHDYKLIYYSWFLLTYLMENNGEKIHKEYQEFLRSVPPSFKYDENNENYQGNIFSIAFIIFWCMNILYIFRYQNEEFQKNKSYFFNAILFFLKKEKIAKNSNQYMICCMVCQKMIVKMPEDKETNMILEDKLNKSHEIVKAIKEKTKSENQKTKKSLDYKDKSQNYIDKENEGKSTLKLKQ